MSSPPLVHNLWARHAEPNRYLVGPDEVVAVNLAAHAKSLENFRPKVVYERTRPYPVSTNILT